jgi:hypothetical protein
MDNQMKPEKDLNLISNFVVFQEKINRYLIKGEL